MRLVKLLGLAIVLLGLYSVTLSNHSLDDSVVVADLNHEISSLAHANDVLRAKIASRGSLTAAAEEIEAKGYTSPDAIATLSAPSEVASR